MPLSIRLLYFPRHDEDLIRRTTEVLGSLSRDGHSDGDLAAIVQAALRQSFPECVIRSRDPLAELWPDASTWYVYRDGSAVASLGRTSEEEEGGPGRPIER